MKGISFEWDDNKAAINEAKHHITFSEASTVFADENAILFDDPNHSQEEERFMMLSRKNVNCMSLLSRYG